MEDTVWRNHDGLLACKNLGWSLTMIQFLSIIIIGGLIAADDSLTKCEVGVAMPWESNTYMPQESSVYVNCTAETSQNPTWSILLPGRSAGLQFAFQASNITLNDFGFYQLSEIDLDMTTTKTIQLLINSTTVMRINGTVIRCIDVGTGTIIVQTVLNVYMSTTVDVHSVDVDIQAVNISWSTGLASVFIQDINQTYTLTVTSSNTLPLTHQLDQSFYVFTAPEGALPCEVYNFSVTARYDIVGTIYTGAGCRVPSQVLSRMLPSLPDIGLLNFSYILVMIAGEIKLNAFFEAGLFCEDYPVLNYTLEIQCSSDSETIIHSIVPQHSNLIGSLSENREYSLRVLAANAIGIVSSSSRQLYTTDVQFITAIHDEGRDVILQCEFILGSVAQGCKVVLVGESENITVHLTRLSNATCAMETFELPLTTDIMYVFGYDIENDWSVGTLAIPGRLNESQSMCMLPSVVTVPSGTEGNSQQSLIIGIVVVLVVIMIVAIIFLALQIIYFVVKRFKSSASGKSIEMSMNEVYVVRTDSIVTTPNEVYGVSTDSIETTPNVVYGVSSDGIETTPNEVYGLSTDNTGNQSNEQRLLQYQNCNRNSGPSPTPVYEEVDTLFR